MYPLLKHGNMGTIVHSSNRNLNSETFWSNLQGGLRVLLVQYFLFDFHESGSESEAFLFQELVGCAIYFTL